MAKVRIEYFRAAGSNFAGGVADAAMQVMVGVQVIDNIPAESVQSAPAPAFAADISGATASTYVATSAGVYTCKITGTNTAGSTTHEAGRKVIT